MSTGEANNYTCPHQRSMEHVFHKTLVDYVFTQQAKMGQVIEKQSDQIDEMIETIKDQQEKMGEIMEKQSEQISEMIDVLKEMGLKSRKKIYKTSMYKPEF